MFLYSGGSSGFSASTVMLDTESGASVCLAGAGRRTALFEHTESFSGAEQLRLWQGAPDGGTASITVVTSSASQPALTVDGTQTLHAAWQDTTGYDLVYARRVNQGWNLETVEDAGYTGYEPTIAVTPSSTPHLVYGGSTDGGNVTDALRWATRGATGWQSEVVAPFRSGARPTLKVDTSGAPHVLWADVAGRSLKYATRTSTGWTQLTVAPAPGGTGVAGAGHDLVFTPQGELAACYSRSTSSTAWPTLFIARLSGGAWTGEAMPAVRANVVEEGRCAIAYASNGDLWVLHGTRSGVGFGAVYVSIKRGATW